jgi:sec-independent protein translocase protein TatA
MNLPGGWELILVALLIMLLFGYKKLPDATRSLGRSMRIFKAETKGLRDDSDTTTGPAGKDKSADAGTTTVTAEPISPPPPPPPHPGPGTPDAEQAQHRQP